MSSYPIVPEIPTERAALIGWKLKDGELLTTAQVAEIACISRSGAYDLMARVSRILPIALIDGVWRVVSEE